MAKHDFEIGDRVMYSANHKMVGHCVFATKIIGIAGNYIDVENHSKDTLHWRDSIRLNINSQWEKISHIKDGNDILKEMI